MSNFLQRLVARSSATTPVVRPQLSPVFGAPAKPLDVGLEGTLGVENPNSLPTAKKRRRDTVDFQERSERSQETSLITRINPTLPSSASDAESQERRLLPEQQEVPSRKTVHALLPPIALEPNDISADRSDAYDQEPRALPIRNRRSVRREPEVLESEAIVEPNESASRRARTALTPVPDAAALPSRGGGQKQRQAHQPKPKSAIEAVSESVSSGRLANPVTTAIPNPFRPALTNLPFLPLPPRAAEAESTVEVTIGHLEIRIPSPDSRPDRVPRAAPPRLSLDDYLRRRSRGGRS